jgi:transcription elongation factor GreA
MTVRGAELLRKELEQLTKVERPKVIQDIAEARAHGDLRENAEYHAAREKQSFVEGRIADIEAKLSNAQIIDIAKMPQTGSVIFGATVTLCNIDNDKQEKYQIVGDDEADIKQNRVSINSPLARAVIGKKVDDEVTVKTPNGEIIYEVIAVEYL